MKFRRDILVKRSIENRYTLGELSALVGTNKTTLSKIECGSSMPTLETFCKLCEWLGKDPNEYFIKDENYLDDTNIDKMLRPVNGQNELMKIMKES